MNTKELIEMLKKAGFFPNEDDANSLIEALDSVQNEYDAIDATIDRIVDDAEIIAEFDDSVTIRIPKELWEDINGFVSDEVDYPKENETDVN